MNPKTLICLEHPIVKGIYLARTGAANDKPIIKGLDGLADSNQLWVRRWFERIVNEIVKRPDKRFENIPVMLKESMFELDYVICKSVDEIEQELKFTSGLDKYANEYKGNARARVLKVIR